MKIAIFTDTFYPEINGVVTCITNICKYLSKKNYRIIVFAPKYPKKMYKLKKEISYKNVEIIRIKSVGLTTNKESRFAFPNIFKHYITFKKFDPDIVHIHTPASIGAMGLVYAKLRKKPIIGTYHTYLPDFLGYISPLKLLQITKLIKFFYPRLNKEYKEIYEEVKKIEDSKKSNIKKKIRKSVVKLTWLYTRLIYNRCNIVTTPSRIMVKELIKNKIKRPVYYLTNGIEIDIFSKNLKELNQEKKDNNENIIKLITVGRLGYEKHVDDLIKALSILKKKVKDLKFNFMIVGNGPELKKLVELKKKLNLSNEIKFVGWVNRIDLPKYYHSADIFITASTIETQGIVVLEAMASGLPVIGVNKLALSELIIDGYNGYKAEPRKPKDIAKKIYYLAKNKELREKLADNAIKSIEEHKIDNAINGFEKAYKKIYLAYYDYKLQKKINKETKKLINKKS